MLTLVIGFTKIEEREMGNSTGAIFEEIMTENFQNLMKHINPCSKTSKNPKIIKHKKNPSEVECIQTAIDKSKN